jgi:two-component system LytT family sensor kinase
MTIKNIILKRLSIILLSSQAFGVLVITPIFFNSVQTKHNFLLIFLMNISFGIICWMLNIIFSVFFIRRLKSLWWKWLASTLCIISLMSLLHPITQNLFTIGIKNVWLFRALGLTLMNAVIFFINTLMDTIETKRHLEDENNQLKINNLQTELAQLKNQINPHFLFNALSSLKSLMRGDPQIAESYLMKLSEFLRASIGQTNDLVSLQEELFLCKKYIDLQKMRFQDGLIYKTEIDSNSLNDRIPFFALQSLVENSLKHNIVSLMNPLTIRVEVKGSKLTIVNNVQALLSSDASSKTGLQNLNVRMKIQTGQPIIITKNQHYFKVRLTLLRS